MKESEEIEKLKQENARLKEENKKFSTALATQSNLLGLYANEVEDYENKLERLKEENKKVMQVKCNRRLQQKINHCYTGYECLYFDKGENELERLKKEKAELVEMHEQDILGYKDRIKELENGTDTVSE